MLIVPEVQANHCIDALKELGEKPHRIGKLAQAKSATVGVVFV